MAKLWGLKLLCSYTCLLVCFSLTYYTFSNYGFGMPRVWMTCQMSRSTCLYSLLCLVTRLQYLMLFWEVVNLLLPNNVFTVYVLKKLLLIRSSLAWPPFDIQCNRPRQFFQVIPWMNLDEHNCLYERWAWKGLFS